MGHVWIELMDRIDTSIIDNLLPIIKKSKAYLELSQHPMYKDAASKSADMERHLAKEVLAQGIRTNGANLPDLKPGSFEAFIKKLWAAAKVALQRLGIKVPDQVELGNLTVQELVNLAHGELNSGSTISDATSNEMLDFLQGKTDTLNIQNSVLAGKEAKGQLTVENYHGAENKVIIKDVNQLQGSTPEKISDTMYEWYLFEKSTGAIFASYVYATEFMGPDMYLSPHQSYTLDGEMFNLISDGFSWTEESLKLNIEIYRKQFGKDPDNLNGSLAEKNLEYFQIEYLKIRFENPSMKTQEIADLAIKKISFGKHRISLGYGKLSVKIKSFDDVYIDGKKYEDLPVLVSIESLPFKKVDDKN